MDRALNGPKRSLEAVRIYAQGKAPFLGVPVIDRGKLQTAVFRKGPLQAACGCPDIVSVHYDNEAKTLVFKGRRSSYALRNMLPNYQVQIRDELTRWAKGKRKGAMTRKLPKNLREDAKRRDEIRKLEKKLGKLYLRAPQNPATAMRSEWRCDNNDRPDVAAWYAEKSKRRALAKIYSTCIGKPNASFRFPWGPVYAAIEAAGARLDESNQYGRVRQRKAHHGIFPDEYLKKLPVFCNLMRKPWDLKPAQPFAERYESYIEDRKRFLEESSQAKFLRDQIEMLKTGIGKIGLEQFAEAA